MISSMFYVYVLQSLDEESRFYIGSTNDLKRRVTEHNSGSGHFTSGQVWRVVYYEAYISKYAAQQRESSLKNDGRVRRFLMDRIRKSLEKE